MGQMAVEVTSGKQDRFVEHVGNPWGFPKTCGEGNLVKTWESKRNFAVAKHREAGARAVWVKEGSRALVC